MECVFFWRAIIEFLLNHQKGSDDIETANEVDQVMSAPNTVVSSGQIAALLERITPSVSDYVNFIIQ